LIVAIIAILAGLLLPAMGKTKQKAQGIQRLNNHRQLTFAWNLYADDNNDRGPTAGGTSRAWVTGLLDFEPSNRSNWDIEQDIKKSPLGLLARQGSRYLEISSRQEPDQTSLWAGQRAKQ
jgi:hypothetical protein